MNPKEFKTEKNVVTKNKSGLKNGVQQVFVLPPNLLQKLGINLGNVGSTHLCPDLEQTKSSHKGGNTEAQDNKLTNSLLNTYVSETKSSNVKDDSSITKTASLMRQSVFLSPTFNITNLNNVTSSPLGREVDSPKINDRDKCITIEAVTTLEHESVGVQEQNNKIQEKNNRNTSDVDSSIENNNLQIYNGPSSSNKPNLSNELKKTINIISEETITLSELSEMKVLQIPLKSSMVPASLNTIVTNMKKGSAAQSNTSPMCDKVNTGNSNMQLHKSLEKIIENDDMMVSKTNSENKQKGNYDCLVKKCLDYEAKSCESGMNENQTYIASTERNTLVESQGSEGNNQGKITHKETQLCKEQELSTKALKDYGQVYCNENIDDLTGKRMLVIDNKNENTEESSSSNQDLPDNNSTSFNQKNNHKQKKYTYINDPIVKDDGNVIQVRFNKLNEIDIDDVEKIECNLSDANTDNNNFDDNGTEAKNYKEDFRDCNDSPMAKTETSQSSTNKTMLKVLENNVQDMNKINPNFYVKGQELAVENMYERYLTKGSKSERKRCLSNSIIGHKKLLRTKESDNDKVMLEDSNSSDIKTSSQEQENSIHVSENAVHVRNEIDTKFYIKDEHISVQNSNESVEHLTKGFISERKRSLSGDSIFGDELNSKATQPKKSANDKSISEVFKHNGINADSNEHENIRNVLENNVQVINKININESLIEDSKSDRKTPESIFNASIGDGVNKELIQIEYSDNSKDIQKKIESNGCKTTFIEQDNVINVEENILNISKNVCVKGQEIPVENIIERGGHLTEATKSGKRSTLSDVNIGHEVISGLTLTLNPKRNNLVSKLCIQGVEKPGGINLKEGQNNTSFKTYSNKKKNEMYENKSFPYEDITCAKEKLDQNFIDVLKTNTSQHLSNLPQFCICNDFGILAFNLYCDEHIHFLGKRSLDCSSDIIFSIYDDDKRIHVENCTENNVLLKDNTDEKDTHCICWKGADVVHHSSDTDLEDTQEQPTLNETENMYNDNNNDYVGKRAEARELNNSKNYLNLSPHKHKNVDILSSEMETNTESNEKTKSLNDRDLETKVPYNSSLGLQDTPRKRKLSNNCSSEATNRKKIKNLVNCSSNKEQPVEPNLEDHDQHSMVDDGIKIANINVQHKEVDNKYLKCGVCNVDVIDAEWTVHIASSHDYIAWKHGEKPINLDDEAAIRAHLHRLVQELGQLVCHRCGLARKYAKSFLQHIKICNSLSDSDSIKNTDDTGIAECAVCHSEVEGPLWIEHIAKEHNYLAWKVSETPLDLNDYQQLCNHLSKIVKVVGVLDCAMCGLERRYAKAFASHVRSCTGKSTTSITLDASNVSGDDAQLEVSIMVKCGVCKEDMSSAEWIVHIHQHHNYQAWREGETPVDFQDETSLRKHLYNIVQNFGALVCAKCGKSRKYVKSYLQHLETCTGPTDSFTIDADATPAKVYKRSVEENTFIEVEVPSMELDRPCEEAEKSSTNNNQAPQEGQQNVESLDSTIKCALCQREMMNSNWINHIGINHDYIAWKDSETPLDVNNYEAVWQHLMNIIKVVGALKCAECGVKRKYPKAYLLHIKACCKKTYAFNDGGDSSLNESRYSDLNTSSDTSCANGDKKMVKCGVCGEEVAVRLWHEHVHIQHNYLAWEDGAGPIDLENEEAIRDHLQDIVRKFGRLTCPKCGVIRRKALMFYQHTKTCEGLVEVSSKPKLELRNSEEIVKCAVCQAEMREALWMDHIYKEHDYLAWRDGDNPIKLDDDTQVRDHLYKILQQVGELICSKCGKARKYARSYLQHHRGCKGDEQSMDDSLKQPSLKEKTSGIVKCSLCQQEMDASEWIDHIGKEHNYVAWKEQDPPLVFENESAVRDHLYNIVQDIGKLVCNKCGIARKYAKGYLQHIETCQRVTWKTINKSIVKAKKEKGDMVKCAVCLETVDDTEWFEHSGKNHGYLAWRDRDPKLNVENEVDVYNHLKNVIQEEGYLECSKCKVHRKYAKSFLQHVKACDGTVKTNGTVNDSLNESTLADDSDVDDTDGSSSVKCGVCGQDVDKVHWIKHIQKEHKYLAWQDGKTPIDVKDKEVVYNHLHAVSVKNNGLICGTCGLVRKYVKAYLHHVERCRGDVYANSDEILECGVCGEKVLAKCWRDHAMRQHYNVAWIVGNTPIDIRNYNEVDKHLREYFEYKHKMVCSICGVSRSSFAGFYAHILTCGKSDEEVETFKEVCEICNQKYLCIYKKQHYGGHRAQEFAKERKIQAANRKSEFEKDEFDCTSGRRRAAEKARSVIGDYAAKLSAINTFKCESCGFESESKNELAKHYCAKRSDKFNEDYNDSDASIKLDDYTSSESGDTEVDSDMSNDDEESTLSPGTRKKNRFDFSRVKHSSKTSKLPFTVRDVRHYLQESAADYLHMFYTDERLYPQWPVRDYEVVSDELLPRYIPLLEESCKVTIANDDWMTYKRFEAKEGNGYSVMFTGASIQCMAWAPAHPEQSDSGNVLAVVCHRETDCPRMHCTDTSCHPALIQMWDFGGFQSTPKMAFGMAHDYGSVWAIDWCPSGARDLLDIVNIDDNTQPRLGLLAMACSNGSAYVFSVPYPEKNQTRDITFYKIEPCVELRVTRGGNKYQATSINWSLEKGYTTVLVGYGDGTTAMYDLATESPLLTAKEGDVTILYPFQDERVHNSCVTALTSSVQGARCSASVTGAAGEARGGARSVRSHLPLAATAALFTPHWPSVLLSGDDTIVGHSASELEWGYAGRRLGGVRALAACVRRARLAAFVPPLLQALRPHPVHSQGHKSLHKKVIAMLEMIPLAKKRSKHTNDELSMKVEPITYEEAIKTYGIEFRVERDLDKTFVQKLQSKLREPYPERFPLADVPALAYCPAPKHPSKLAVATHAGVIFLVDV